MKVYHQQQRVQLFGRQVTTFPDGISTAFNDLRTLVTDADKREYYGISKQDQDGKIEYWAAAEEKAAGEAEKFNCERFSIDKGEYLSEAIQNWHSQLNMIKHIFGEMMDDPRTDKSKPCIEWYRSENEMLCMQQMDTLTTLFSGIDKAAAELLQLFKTFSEEQINHVPFEGSWTPAQLATHVTKSNAGIVHALDMQGKLPERKPTERVAELENIFLNFESKMKSPVFIQPPAGMYHRQAVIEGLNTTTQQLVEKRSQVNLLEEIDFFAFGKITRVELLHFVLYHTQRHIHQLKQMAAKKA